MSTKGRVLKWLAEHGKEVSPAATKALLLKLAEDEDGDSGGVPVWPYPVWPTPVYPYPSYPVWCTIGGGSASTGTVVSNGSPTTTTAAYLSGNVTPTALLTGGRQQ